LANNTGVLVMLLIPLTQSSKWHIHLTRRCYAR